MIHDIWINARKCGSLKTRVRYSGYVMYNHTSRTSWISQKTYGFKMASLSSHLGLLNSFPWFSQFSQSGDHLVCYLAISGSVAASLNHDFLDCHLIHSILFRNLACCYFIFIIFYLAYYMPIHLTSPYSLTNTIPL